MQSPRSFVDNFWRARTASTPLNSDSDSQYGPVSRWKKTIQRRADSSRLKVLGAATDRDVGAFAQQALRDGAGTSVSRAWSRRNCPQECSLARRPAQR